jgi:hypothetical protein
MPRDLDARVFVFACRIVDLFELLYPLGGAARALPKRPSSGSG